MADEITAGTVVQLKSGGPHMTVSNLHQWQGRMEANCDWFEGTKMQNGSFPITSLRVVAEDRPSSAAVVGLAGGDPSTAWMR